MLEKAILESTIFYNFSRIYHQLTSTVTTVDLDNTFETASNNSLQATASQETNQIATKPKMVS
jgi:hypothetical protein